MPIRFAMLLMSAVAWNNASVCVAEPTTLPATQPASAGIDHLRAAIESAYNAGDTDRMLRYIHPDAVIIFPDGQILNGREALRQYYDRMMKGPGHRVARYSANPIVQSRTVHGDVALSYGLMNDHYVLTDGRQFDLNSRFTVTVFKSPAGPPDTDGWMIRSFHSSSDVFDNAILSMSVRKASTLVGIVGIVVGAVLTCVILTLFRRRARRSQSIRPTD